MRPLLVLPAVVVVMAAAATIAIGRHVASSTRDLTRELRVSWAAPAELEEVRRDLMDLAGRRAGPRRQRR